MIDETDVVTYKSENAARSDLNWIAQVVLPNGKYWGVYFTGSTESEVVAKAIDLWNSEQARPLGLIPRLRDHKPEVFSEPPSSDSAWPSNPLPNDPWASHGINATTWANIAADDKSNKQGHATKGMVWLIHKINRTKCRVRPEVAEGMLASGDWERGGPRSK